MSYDPIFDPPSTIEPFTAPIWQTMVNHKVRLRGPCEECLAHAVLELHGDFCCRHSVTDKGFPKIPPQLLKFGCCEFIEKPVSSERI